MLIHSPKQLALLAKQQRKKLRLSQAEVGKLVGLKQQTISEFEINPEKTLLETVFRILSALSLDINVLPKETITKTKSQWKKEW